MFSLSLVAAVNNDSILHQNLLKSNLINEVVDVSLHRGARSAACAYNAGMKATSGEVIIFAHQDVYFPRPWIEHLKRALDQLSAEDPHWGVLGVIGKTNDKQVFGRVWSTGGNREYGEGFEAPVRVRLIDEVVIILRRSKGLSFDEALPGFHLYGTDICLTSERMGFNNYVIHAPVVHNSVPVRTLRGPYHKAYKYMRQKWSAELPIYTLIAPITKAGFGFWRTERWLFRDHVFNRRRTAEIIDPKCFAKRLHYE